METDKDDDKKLVAWGWAGISYLSKMWQTYRINLEDFNKFWDNQEGKCAGCGKEFAHPKRKEMKMGYKPEVDHCHKSGKVRGLLCRRCNDLLGKVQDNQDVMRNLVEYLKRNGDWV